MITPTLEETQSDLRYLKLLAEKFPNIQSASTEVINLEAILSLPKGTEHFLSDLHGEVNAFEHVLRNASGVIRRKADEQFGDTLTDQEKRELCALIYYPEERLAIIHQENRNLKEWYPAMLRRTIEIARAVSSKYTRSKVRKQLPQEFAYIIEELMHQDTIEDDKEQYYNAIIQTIIDTNRSDEFLIAICNLIHRLTIDILHIVGDIYDRGPGACHIMETLSHLHDYDIQWGNHDIEWMGAAAGNQALIASVLRISIRYANVETLEEGYSINLLPLATLAIDVYGDDPCTIWQTKDFENNPRLKRSAQLMAKMHKCISIMEFKLAGQIIKRHPEWGMDDRLFLHLINKEKGTITIDGKEYELLDKNLPSLDPNDPYKLCPGEEQLMQQLVHSFRSSEKLQKHLRMLYQHGSLFLVRNNCLLYHAAIPLNDDGSFMELEVDGKKVKGKALMERVDGVIRRAYFGTRNLKRKQNALDYMLYLWCGPGSPLYNKDKMTTFERYFIADESLYKESKGAYFKLGNNPEICANILKEFGLDPEKSRIINGHVPVRTLKGESPVRAGGMRLVIDGGFSKAYHATTGIAGYTLIYNSHGLELVQHNQFQSKEEVISSGTDIHSRIQLAEFKNHRMLVRDTDRGQELIEQVNNLQKLLLAYHSGLIKEKS